MSVHDFVQFWFREPLMVQEPYDYFLLKIDRFIEFVQDTLPDAIETASREAAGIRTAYHIANEL